MAKIVGYIVLLGIVLAAAAVAAGYVAARFYGPGAYAASAVAAAINWFAGSIALSIVGASSDPTWRVQGALLGMMVRMAVALGAIIFFMNTRLALTADGVVALIVVHYLVGLVVETALTLRLVAAASPPGAPAGLASGPNPPAP